MRNGKKINIKEQLNSKGASIFKKMLDDKKAIHEHLRKGGKLTELKNKYKFVKGLNEKAGEK